MSVDLHRKNDPFTEGFCAEHGPVFCFNKPRNIDKTMAQRSNAKEGQLFVQLNTETNKRVISFMPVYLVHVGVEIQLLTVVETVGGLQ